MSTEANRSSSPEPTGASHPTPASLLFERLKTVLLTDDPLVTDQLENAISAVASLPSTPARPAAAQETIAAPSEAPARSVGGGDDDHDVLAWWAPACRVLEAVKQCDASKVGVKRGLSATEALERVSRCALQLERSGAWSKAGETRGSLEAACEIVVAARRASLAPEDLFGQLLKLAFEAKCSKQQQPAISGTAQRTAAGNSKGVDGERFSAPPDWSARSPSPRTEEEETGQGQALDAFRDEEDDDRWRAPGEEDEEHLGGRDEDHPPVRPPSPSHVDIMRALRAASQTSGGPGSPGGCTTFARWRWPSGRVDTFGDWQQLPTDNRAVRFATLGVFPEHPMALANDVKRFLYDSPPNARIRSTEFGPFEHVIIPLRGTPTTFLTSRGLRAYLARAEHDASTPDRWLALQDVAQNPLALME